MANPNHNDIKADVGFAWNLIDASTTAVTAVSLITKAQNDVKDLTGTTTGASQDRAIRNLTDAYMCQNALMKLDPNKEYQTVLEGARDKFLELADNALRLKGKTIDGIRFKFSQVNP